MEPEGVRAGVGAAVAGFSGNLLSIVSFLAGVFLATTGLGGWLLEATLSSGA